MPVVAIGKKKSVVGDVVIETDPLPCGTNRYRYTVSEPATAKRIRLPHSLKPKRLIFNPGAENDELGALAQQHGIRVQKPNSPGIAEHGPILNLLFTISNFTTTRQVLVRIE